MLVDQINIQSAHALRHSAELYKTHVLARNYAAQPIYANPYITRVIISDPSRYFFTRGGSRRLACISFFSHSRYYYGNG